MIVHDKINSELTWKDIFEHDIFLSFQSYWCFNLREYRYLWITLTFIQSKFTVFKINSWIYNLNINLKLLRAWELICKCRYKLAYSIHIDLDIFNIKPIFEVLWWYGILSIFTRLYGQEGAVDRPLCNNYLDIIISSSERVFLVGWEQTSWALMCHLTMKKHFQKLVR